MTGSVLLGLAVAAEGDASTAVTGSFLQLGAIGALALCLLWFSYRVYNRETKRADAAEMRYLELQAKVIEQYVPTVTKAAEVLTEAITELRAARERR